MPLRSLGVAALILCLAAPARSQTAADVHRDRVLSVARQIMIAARYCTLITIGADGQPQARVVDPLGPDETFNVYVATNPLSRKVGEMGKDPRVTLLYFDTARSAYVTLIGRAVATSAEEKKAHHKKVWQPFFSLDRPESYALYRVTASRLEVVSARDGLSGDPSTWRPEIIELK
ncbi:MAG: pyridoxamine 5'-phosphate oxidase family protein [Vicinamibacteria bacterium]